MATKWLSLLAAVALLVLTLVVYDSSLVGIMAPSFVRKESRGRLRGQYQHEGQQRIEPRGKPQGEQPGEQGAEQRAEQPGKERSQQPQLREADQQQAPSPGVAVWSEIVSDASRPWDIADPFLLGQDDPSVAALSAAARESEVLLREYYFNYTRDRSAGGRDASG